MSLLFTVPLAHSRITTLLSSLPSIHHPSTVTHPKHISHPPYQLSTYTYLPSLSLVSIVPLTRTIAFLLVSFCYIIFSSFSCFFYCPHYDLKGEGNREMASAWRFFLCIYIFFTLFLFFCGVVSDVLWVLLFVIIKVSPPSSDCSVCVSRYIKFMQLRFFFSLNVHFCLLSCSSLTSPSFFPLLALSPTPPCF